MTDKMFVYGLWDGSTEIGYYYSKTDLTGLRKLVIPILQPGCHKITLPFLTIVKCSSPTGKRIRDNPEIVMQGLDVRRKSKRQLDFLFTHPSFERIEY